MKQATGKFLSWAAVASILGLAAANLPNWIQVMQDCDLSWPRLGCPDPDQQQTVTEPVVTEPNIAKPATPDTPPTAPKPAPDPASAPQSTAPDRREASVRAGGSLSLCGHSFTVTFRIGPNGDPQQVAYLNGPGEDQTLRAGMQVAIPPNCMITLDKAERRANGPIGFFTIQE